MRLYFTPLDLDEMPQLPLHRFESVVHYFAQRIVRAVIHLFFIGDELMTGRHGHINSHSKWISFLMGMIRLLDRDVATANVITKTI